MTNMPEWHNLQFFTMPELAEVEYFRRQWDPGIGQTLHRIHTHPKARIFQNCPVPALTRTLTQDHLAESHAHGKQLAFRTSRGAWLGLHLGMSGELRLETSSYTPQRHDHLILFTRRSALVFSDPRMFGRVRWHPGPDTPAWWADLPPLPLSPAFTPAHIQAALAQHHRSPLKAVLLNQNHFPGIGNWMADEILWRAGIHPAHPAGSLTPPQLHALWRHTRQVTRDALRVIGQNWGTPPDSWLFNHRWRNGGTCPRSGGPLARSTIAGRTTCWSPQRQKLPRPTARM